MKQNTWSKDTEYFTIFSQRLAGYLMLNGVQLIFIKQNKNDEKKNVFYFKNTDQLHKKIEEYKTKKNALNKI